MRIIAVSPQGALDSSTGIVHERIKLDHLLLQKPGGLIVGNNLYPVLAPLAPEIRKDTGWTMCIRMQDQRVNPMNRSETRRTGKIYVSYLSYRYPKVGTGKSRRRPRGIKWTVIDIGLFLETPPIDLAGILKVGESFANLANERGTTPRPSPGGMGSAMLRASPLWKDRKPAPRFISDFARKHLPGNFYAVSERYQKQLSPIDHCYYLDQESSHHKIASSIPLPDPNGLHARGYLREVENGESPRWVDDPNTLLRNRHIGALCCVVEVGIIPAQQQHLYPPWCSRRGQHLRWLWTPEFRLFQKDHRIQINRVCAALTSTQMDFALNEYAEWCLQQRKKEDKSIIKSSLLAAYGMLACRSDVPLPVFTVHGRPKPPRAITVELPLIDKVYRSEVKFTRTPSIQNVVARGVIEAETRTRSLEYAKDLEDEGIRVAQIYADGLLAVTDQLPLTIPEHWRIAASLKNVKSPHPNSIISDELVRLPGILSASQEAYIHNYPAGPIRDNFTEKRERGREIFN